MFYITVEKQIIDTKRPKKYIESKKIKTTFIWELNDNVTSD